MTDLFAGTVDAELIAVCDTNRHLICLPYSPSNLHIVAQRLKIRRCWYHNKPDRAHYDIPKTRKEEIEKYCKEKGLLISTRELFKFIIKKNDN